MEEAYIIKGYRTAVGKAPRGFFRFKRPDELAAETIEYMISNIEGFDKKFSRVLCRNLGFHFRIY